jgi:crotonobetainyl-CoA:carnitine CoA-transferase CaiB-like acyl-CoA transferase
MAASTTYAGVRVLDLSENIAGPLAAMLLADLGADVIKVERVGSGDATRALPPRTPAGDSTVFLAFNRNKRSVELDLAGEQGHADLMRIARDVDVVICSYRPGVAEKLGLGFDDFTAVSDRVVYASISAFGTGPVGTTMIGYDGLVQAFGGMMDLTGEPEGRPVRAAASVVDLTTGMWTAMGIMTALARRQQGAGAQRVHGTLLDSSLAMLAHQISGVRGAGVVPDRLGAAAPSAAPYDAYGTTTSEVMIAAVTDRHFRRLCGLLDLTHLAEDDRFADAAGRVAHRSELTSAIAAVLAGESCEHWCSALGRAGIPVAPVNSLPEALESVVTLERGLLTVADDDASIPLMRTPLDDGSSPLRRPPALGEHTDEVLAEFGRPIKPAAG